MLFTPGIDPDPLPIIVSSEINFLLVSSRRGQVLRLKEGDNRVGRALLNDIHIEGEKISRFHAKIVVLQGSVEVVDLGSTNGTFHKGARLSSNQPVDLPPGEVIGFWR